MWLKLTVMSSLIVLAILCIVTLSTSPTCKKRLRYTVIPIIKPHDNIIITIYKDVSFFVHLCMLYVFDILVAVSYHNNYSEKLFVSPPFHLKFGETPWHPNMPWRHFFHQEFIRHWFLLRLGNSFTMTEFPGGCVFVFILYLEFFWR